MPVFNFLVVAGLALIALLFVAGATLDKGSPAVVTSQYGLPKPWRPDPIHLAAAPAPAPDMTSPLVLAAAPKAQSAPEVLAKVEPAARAARAEAPPKKKRVTGTQQPPVDYRQNHAWSRDRDHAPFGGERFFFGRF